MEGNVLVITLLLAFGYALQDDTLDSPSIEIDSRENTTQRIVGGYKAAIEDFPWQVSISRNGHHHCGGSIIGNRYILTAAHCTFGVIMDSLNVRAGSSHRSHGGFVYEITSVYNHPDFDPETFHCDISILVLNEDLVFTAKVQPVTLPRLDDPEAKPGTFATVTGFGQLKMNTSKMSHRLMAAEVAIIPIELCKELYHSQLIDETMICADSPVGRKDSCTGDSGGPLTVGDVQIGITSWGVGCALPLYPGVYASVKNLMKFISKTAYEYDMELSK